MEPLTMAAVSFGLNAVGSGLGFMGQQEAAAQNNQAIEQRNAYAMQQYAYNEQLKDFEYRNQLKIYDMRVEQANLQIKQYQNAYADYYFDEQTVLNDMIDQVRIQALQSDIKLEEAQSSAMASSLARGVTGRRAGGGGMIARNAIMAGMEGVERARQLSIAAERTDERIQRTAEQTNLMSKMAYNAIGPVPERTPVGPAPYMEQLDPGPSSMGLYAGLLSDAGNAVGVYGSLKAPSAGNITSNSGASTNYSLNLMNANTGSSGYNMPALKY